MANIDPAILNLPGLLEELGALAENEERFLQNSQNCLDDLDQAQFDLGRVLTEGQNQQLNDVCIALENALSGDWDNFQNGWRNNRLALVNFMLATPAFAPVHQQLRDEEL